MALDPAKIDTMVADFQKAIGNGATITDAISALATEHEVSDAAIRYHLKKRNLVGENAKSAEATPSDEDLGIGQEDADYSKLLSDPKFLTALAEKLGVAQAAVPAVTAPSELREVADVMRRMIEVQAIQQPGYSKPISAGEMDRREEGRQKMFALLDRFKEQRSPPHYVLGENWPANDILYEAGQEVRTYLPPAEHFQPQNDEARQVMKAMYQWLGGPTPDIGETVEAFERWRKGTEVPLVGSAEVLKPSDVEVVSTAKRDVQPKRILGNIVPETRGTSMPKQPGVVAPPTGPIYVDS
jgi:hypothetical protein